MKTIQHLRAPLLLLGVLALVALAGCGPVKLVANTNIPTPLVVKIPIAVALFITSSSAKRRPTASRA